MSLFWELSQQRQIADAKATAAQAEQNAGKVYETIRHLELRLEKLTLVSRALWTFVKERSNLTEEDLFKRVSEIDLSDGALDGKVKHPPADCRSCGRKLSRRHLQCIYCGSEKLGQTAFDTV